MTAAAAGADPAVVRPQGHRLDPGGFADLRGRLYRDPSHGGHDVAVFERKGRTCVLAGHVMRVSTLVKLAAWKGGGAVRS